ncbi:MAG: DUF5615 family PIN-like protein [Chromatiaceae bacterium]
MLLDTCVGGGTAKQLTAAGYDIRWMGLSEPDPGDEATIRVAYEEERILITLDKDFGDLAIVYGMPHRGIIRLVGFAARPQGKYCIAALQRFEHELSHGAIVTVMADRVRIRLSD